MKIYFLLITVVILIIALGAEAQVKGTFIDSRDNKTYKTVKIGAQTWMAENLAYKASSGCWAYNNDVNIVTTYGYLYNWETAITVCPTGLQLPSDSEWSILTDYFGDESVVGGKLKETDTTHWNSPNARATNESGFTALPGGDRYENGNFRNIGKDGSWWSSTEFNSDDFWYRYLIYDYSSIGRDHYSKTNGFSVRCIKD